MRYRRMSSILSKDFANVWILSLSTALASSLATLMVFLGSLVGASLTPAAELAMVPVAIMTTGTAFGMIPATYAMDYLGRKAGLLLFIGLGLGGCMVAIIALQYSSFVHTKYRVQLMTIDERLIKTPQSLRKIRCLHKFTFHFHVHDV